jgi:glutaredoxin 3
MGPSRRAPTSTADVVIYRTRFCPYCGLAERFLASKGVAFREVDVSGNEECRRWLYEETGMRTVPQIFVNGRSVGGFTDMVACDRSGELDALLSEPPASRVSGPPCDFDEGAA